LTANVWKSTLPVQPSSIVGTSIHSQPIPFVSQIHTHQSIPLKAQINVIQSLQASIMTHFVLMVFGTSQIPLTWPLQGNLQPQHLGQGIPQILVGKNSYGMP